MSRFIFVSIAALATMVLTPTGVSADVLTLPTDTVIWAPEGSTIELGRVAVDTELAGPLCTWTATVTNQSSAHQGNDIVVRSGDSELILAGVEDTEFKVTTSSGSAYLASEIIAELRMGPDEVFSGGLSLEINYSSCETVPTTTTTELAVAPEPSGPTTIETTTTAPPAVAPTTTAPAAVAPTTIAPTTTVAAPAPEAPILPVTGTRELLPVALIGLSLIVVGAALLRFVRPTA